MRRASPTACAGRTSTGSAWPLRRIIPINERVQFIFGIDGSNLTNHTTFGNNAGNNQINVNVNSGANFGTLNFASADPRDFQFSGRFQF